MIALTAQQAAIIDSDVKTDISWLFEIDRTGNGSVDDYWSTKAKTFGGQAYAFKIVKHSDVTLQRNRSEFGMQAPGKFSFTLSNKGTTLKPADFAGGNVTVKSVVKSWVRKATVTVTGGTKPAAGATMTGATSGETAVLVSAPDAWAGAVSCYFVSQSGAFEAENVSFTGGGTGTIAANIAYAQEEALISSWNYAFVSVGSAYQKLTFNCQDWITKYLEGTYPKTQNLGRLWSHWLGDAWLDPASARWVNDKVGSGISDTCPPVIFGEVFIPVYPTIVQQGTVRGDAYYVLGAGSGDTEYEFLKMLSPDQSTTWEPGAGTGRYTVSYDDLVGNDGVTYVGLRVIAVDADGDGSLDSNPVVKSGEVYSPMFVRYHKGAGGTDYTNPADILSYVLTGFGIPVGKLDATSLAALKSTCTARGIAWSFGLYQPTDKKKLLADLLLQCDCELIIRDKIYFKVHSKTSVKSLTTAHVIRQSFTASAVAPSASDSGYVQHRVFTPATVGATSYAVTNIVNGVCVCTATTGLAINDFVQFDTTTATAVSNKIFKVTAVVANTSFTLHDVSIVVGTATTCKEVETVTNSPDTNLTRSSITASGTTDSPTASNDMPGWAVTLTGANVPDATIARTLGTLGLQRVLNRIGDVSLKGKGKLCALEPDDVITMTAAAHGAGTGLEYDVLIDSISIAKDLTVSVTASRFNPALSDFADITPATLTIVNGQIVQTYSPVVSGPDKVDPSGAYTGNTLQGRLRVGTTGNFILLDPVEPIISLSEGGQVRVKIGDLGTDDYGIELLDHAGTSIFKMDGAGVNLLSGWVLSADSLTKTNGGNTVTLSTGATAFAAGPTGAPTVTITQAGLLTATGAAISGMITGSYVYGSSLMTKGTYLAASCAAADATLNVGSTADFPASGTAWFIDSANDRDAFTYTGKTATTLTGCSGVLAHTVSASNKPLVVPSVKGMYISDAGNEMRFFGDRGDGTVEELASIGISPTESNRDYVGVFGSMSGNRSGLKSIIGNPDPYHPSIWCEFGDSPSGWSIPGNSSVISLYNHDAKGNAFLGVLTAASLADSAAFYADAYNDDRYGIYIKHGKAYIGGTVVIASGYSLGLGAAKGRITFTGAAVDDIAFADCTVTLPNTGLHILDTDASHDLIVVPGSNLSADRTLTITTGDANRTLTLAGDATVSGTNTGDHAESYIYIRDEKAQNTHGGTFTSGAWRTRDLNTEVNDAGGHASVSSNQITLAAGTYKFKASAPGWVVDSHQCRLANTTDGIYYYGTTERADSSLNGFTRSFVEGRFTITGSKVFELQHRCITTAGAGFGFAANLATEVYATVEFWRE